MLKYCKADGQSDCLVWKESMRNKPHHILAIPNLMVKKSGYIYLNCDVLTNIIQGITKDRLKKLLTM
jgi:hypothetical protein